MFALWFLIILIGPIESVVGEMDKGVFQGLVLLRVRLGGKPHKTILVQVQPGGEQVTFEQRQ